MFGKFEGSSHESKRELGIPKDAQGEGTGSSLQPGFLKCLHTAGL